MTLSNTERGANFERRVAEHYRSHYGGTVEILGAHKATERGIDVLVTTPGGRRIGVQAKAHAPGTAITASEVQSMLFGGAMHWRCDEIHLVTTGQVSDSNASLIRQHGGLINPIGVPSAYAAQHHDEPDGSFLEVVLLFGSFFALLGLLWIVPPFPRGLLIFGGVAFLVYWLSRQSDERLASKSETGDGDADGRVVSDVAISQPAHVSKPEFPRCEACGVEYIQGEACGCGIVREAPKTETTKTRKPERLQPRRPLQPSGPEPFKNFPQPPPLGATGEAAEFQNYVYESQVGLLRFAYMWFLRDDKEAQVIEEDQEARGLISRELVDRRAFSRVTKSKFPSDDEEARLIEEVQNASPSLANILHDWDRSKHIDLQDVEKEVLEPVLEEFVCSGGDDTQFWEIMTRIAIRHNDGNAPQLTPEGARSWAANKLGSDDVETLALTQWDIDVNEIRKEKLSDELLGAFVNEEWWFLRSLAELDGENVDEYYSDDEEEIKAALSRWAEKKYGTSDVRELASQQGVDVAAAEREARLAVAEHVRHRAERRAYLARRRKVGDPPKETPIGSLSYDPPWYSAAKLSEFDDRERETELEAALPQAKIDLRLAVEDALPPEVEWPLSPSTFHLIDVDRAYAFGSDAIAVVVEKDMRKWWVITKGARYLREEVPEDPPPPWHDDFSLYVKEVLADYLRQEPKDTDVRVVILRIALREIDLYKVSDP